jgi:hypothetical protein
MIVARLAAMCGFIMLGCPNSNNKVYISNTSYSFFKKNIYKFKVALQPRLGLKPADGHFGFKPWSPSEISHVDVDVLCIDGHVSSAL